VEGLRGIEETARRTNRIESTHQLLSDQRILTNARQDEFPPSPKGPKDLLNGSYKSSAER
jgi:hypothetical protein